MKCTKPNKKLQNNSRIKVTFSVISTVKFVDTSSTIKLLNNHFLMKVKC